jgi:predicted CxxxxCH...CXXCH cytochrome family protein
MTDANQKTICAYCHTGVMGESGHDDASAPASVGSFDRIFDGAPDSATAGAYTWTVDATNGVCSNVDCHNNIPTATTPTSYDWWDGAATGCVMCHTPGAAGNNPASGLHSGVLTVSGVNHDDSFATTGNCATCHTVPAYGGTHINGTFPANDTAAGTNEYNVTLTGYTDAAVNAITCSGAGVSAANCHGIDPIDAGTWARKWSTTARNSDGTECANCHGGFGANDWTFGSAAVTNDFQVSHGYNWDGDANTSEVIGNHSGSTQATRCQSCHVYPDAPYVWGTNHRIDRKVTMNSTMGYSGTTFLCSTSCHAVNTNHNLEAASNAIYTTRANTLAGPPITCGQCHQSGVKIGMATGAHSIHGANDTDISANSGADCAVCHGATGAYTSTLGGAHGDNIVNFSGLTYSGARGVLTGTCTNNTACHNSASEPSEAWNAANLLCNDCHGDATGGLSASHTDHFTKGAVCTSCHATVAAGDTTHINGTTSLADKSNAAQDEASVVFTSNAAGATDYTFVDGDNSCHTPNPATGLACHATGGSAGAADPTRPVWGTAIGNLDCTNYCHTNNTLATVNPVSGLHSSSPAPTVSGKAHDENLVVATKCTVCHNILIGTATHLNGTFTGDTVANLALVSGVGYTQAGVTNNGTGSCSGAVSPLNGTTCHGPAGSGDAGTWARLWDSSVSYQALGSNPENVANSVCDGCHGTFAGGWTTGTAANTTDGQVEHGRNWDGDGSAEVAANHGDPKDCTNCHVLGDAAYPDTTNAAHRNNQITMNSDASSAYNSTNWYCATTCHGTVGHNLEDSGFTTVQMIDGPGATCVGCHKAEGGGSATAPKVIWSNGSATTGATAHDTVYGSHLKTATGEVLNTATNFDTQCLKCHPGHSGGYTITLPPTAYSNGVIAPYDLRATLKIDYATNGGIHIGGTSTPTITSEAIICWNCHTANNISEWGSNSNVLTGTSSYDYGTLKTAAYTGSATADWVAGIWHSANGLTASSQIFGYKQGATKSIHSANPTAGQQTMSGTLYSAMTETREGVADIRCSYCHDVHNHKTKDPAADVGPSGQPYLRGTYTGNKYKEDGAPHSSITYSNSAQYGAVPRGASANALMGGYFIDQNSANPTSTINVTGAGATAAGLCELCHGSGDGTWTAGELATIDYKTGEGLWISSNGHANSVKQATKTTAAANNIFDFTHGRPTPVAGTSSSAKTGAIPSQGMVGQGSNDGYSYRGNDSSSYNGMYTPGVPTSGSQLPNYDWGATVDAGTVNSTFHNFICSKCHNPHASRLPKLMITNCLDINHNTWDDAKTSQTAYTRTYLLNGVSTRADRNKKMAYFSSAQNCHRRDDNTLITPALNPGWNKVTPW